MLSGDDQWWNNKIELRCYNNHELGCCIKSDFACSTDTRTSPVDSPNYIQYVETWLWTTLLFYQSCSIMLTVLLQGCWANNPVIACDIFTRVVHDLRFPIRHLNQTYANHFLGGQIELEKDKRDIKKVTCSLNKYISTHNSHTPSYSIYLINFSPLF